MKFIDLLLRFTIVFGFIVGEVYCWQDPQMMAFSAELGQQLSTAYWQQKGVDALKKRNEQLVMSGFSKNKKRAKNVILFMGDGCGISTMTASRKFKETYAGTPFYDTELTWDSFPFSGYSKTYALDSVIPESAGTATAFLTGVKTRMGFIGLDGVGDLQCFNKTKGRLESIAARAVRAGKVAGLVTTTTITNASPAPVYASIPAPLRYYEYYTDKYPFPKTHPKCEDIASQFVNKGHFLQVALGGGRAYFSPNTSLPNGETNKPGLRTDGRNLIEEWKTDRWQRSNARPTYVTRREELINLDPKSVEYLLGLFSYEEMAYVDDKPPDSEPTLAEMTIAAIKVLSKHDNGFFLFVEGGKIDLGHHLGIARYALTEAIELDKAVKAALSMTDPKETLIVVTADHSHTMTMSGFIGHDTSILGTSVELADDQRTYTVLMYANGPNTHLKAPDGGRRNDTTKETSQRGYKQQATVPVGWELHGGEDVPVYANGPNAELFSGVFEQSYINWAISCAVGIHYGPTGQLVRELQELCPAQPADDEEKLVQQAVNFNRKCAAISSNKSNAPGIISIIACLAIALNFNLDDFVLSNY